MDQCIPRSGMAATSPSEEIEMRVEEGIAWLRPRLVELLRGFAEGPRNPASFFAFELTLVTLLRDLGRELLQSFLNGLEGDGQLRWTPIVGQNVGLFKV